MKRLIYVPMAIVALAPFFGCSSVDVDIPEAKYSNEAVWTGRTLQNVRYYNTTVEAVAKAAVAAARAQGLFYTGDDPDNRGGTVLYFRGDLDVKVTIDVSLTAPSKKDPNAQQYVEVAIVYGNWGDLGKSQKLVSGITQNL